MARLALDKWEDIRAEYEVGASQSELAWKYKVSRKAIQNHIKQEKWVQEDVSVAVSRKVAEKIAKVAGSDPQKRAAAVDAAADKVVAIVERHQKEWEDHSKLVDEAVGKRNFELAKLAKITAETIMIRQTGERRAHNLDKEAGDRKSLAEVLEGL